MLTIVLSTWQVFRHSLSCFFQTSSTFKNFHNESWEVEETKVSSWYYPKPNISNMWIFLNYPRCCLLSDVIFNLCNVGPHLTQYKYQDKAFLFTHMLKIICQLTVCVWFSLIFPPSHFSDASRTQGILAQSAKPGKQLIKLLGPTLSVFSQVTCIKNYFYQSSEPQHWTLK